MKPPTGSQWRVSIAALVIGALALPSGLAQARGESAFTPGSAGLGDSYFPLFGNGGYDVEHYGLHIRYDPATDGLVGRARIDAVATKDLSRFNLDFIGLRVHSLTVDGERARWARVRGRELVVTPSVEVEEGGDLAVVVRYSGVPKLLGGTLGQGGVFPTDDGAVIVGQPEVAATWFPVNDHPRDKATYTIRLTVPTGLEAISNGVLTERSRSGGWSTWTWSHGGAMASYLATAAIGEFEIRRRTTSYGLPILDAVDVKVGAAADRALALEEEVVSFLSRRFGPYPFQTVGGIVEHHDIGFALETQTRPVYDYRIFTLFDRVFQDGFVVHELAHMWYGDEVAVGDWRHIWLNEGPATYAEWMWHGGHGRDKPREFFAKLCATPKGDAFWDVKTGDPGPASLFDFEAVYLRGAMTLEALRRAVGGEAFFDIIRTWASDNADGLGSTREFKELAERVSGRQLDKLFRNWLFRAAKPPACSSVR
jgi:aminopeptidase N